ncbi:hypothetical protein EYV94_00195 [Puteibacter caeruleilacunae]|nr:hypothetical protein EYV94_00195 [Puteibacter caeruleilacunae]
MIKTRLTIIACLFSLWGVAQHDNIDHKLISDYEYSHDLDLPDWGPYSKKYNGISHVTSKEQGFRFDLSFATGYFQRSKMVIPDVVEERDYFIWDVTPDLKYLGYNYQLEWKDKVKCEVVFSEIDENSRFITAKFVNNTATRQDVVYNLLASMNYPRKKEKGVEQPVLPVRVELPTGGMWIDGMEYASMDYANPRFDDNLIYDGFTKGEVYGGGMVNSRALGRNFGKDKGDQVIYRFKSIDASKGLMLIRYKTNTGADAAFNAEGIVNGEIVLKGSTEFTTQQIPVSSGDLLKLTATKENSAVVIDGFALVNDVNQVKFIQEEFTPVPEITKGPVPNSVILNYENTDQYYGILWEGPEFYQVEIHSDNLKNLPAYNNRNIDVASHVENDRGHFTDILVYGIEVMPFSDNELNGLVTVGTKAEVESALRKFRSAKTSYKNTRDKIYNEQLAGPCIDRYDFAMKRMEAVMANNLVFPIICQNEYIKHYTPGRRWNSLYTWDVGMIGIGMLEMDLNRSVNILNTYTTAPENPNAFIHHGTPAPTQIYQFLEIWNKTNDKEFLKHYYPRLKKYYQFLSGSYGTSITKMKSGLTKTWDYFYNSAGWDDYPPQRWVEHHDRENLITPAISPTHAIRSAKILRKAAEQLGLNDDLKMYDADIKSISKALQKYSWDEESGYFSYVKHNEQGEVIDILRSENGENMNMGMDGASPIIAGVCTDAQREVIVEKLLDKTRLWTKLGICVDQKASHANVNAYANETVWISHQWFFWKSLLDLGYGQEAWELADVALSAFSDETNRTYHCWEHYTQNSLLGTGWHQFSGLNAPLVNWYHLYFKSGNVYGGFDFWIKSKEMNEDCTKSSIEFELSDLHRSKKKTVLVSMNDKYDYKVKLNGKVIPHKRITEHTLMVAVPSSTATNRLVIEQVGKRERTLF